MKRTLLIAATLAILPAGATLAAPASACPTASLLQQADDPRSCFKGGALADERTAEVRGAAGPVKTEMQASVGAQQDVPLEIRHSYGDPGWYRAL
ncbi:MAG: hypothetical protein HY778_17430 [Betaproteobacteria bacterium]|nr:hypothetical protein [Betaproteobacteria bacterium]